MTLRRRVTLVVAVAVSIAVALTAIASYLAVRSALFGQVDEQLRRQATALTSVLENAKVARALPSRIPLDADRLPRLAPSEGGPLGYVQIVRPSGDVLGSLPLASTGVSLPVDAADRAIARGQRTRLLRTIAVDGDPVRMLTVSAGDAGAIQLGTPLAGANAVVRRLSILLLGIGLAGLALAVILSRVVTRRVTAPVRALAAAAAHVAETDDLALRITVDRDDELGQLARRFNSMLDRLQESRTQLAGSVTAQRQLVADASHELRTPITSLRTNLEVLLDGGELEAEERAALLASLVDQTEELGDLVVDVIELARGDTPLSEPEAVRLDEIVADEVRRAERHHPGVVFIVQTEPRVVIGAPDRLARAAANLLDNAARHGARGADRRVEVVVGVAGLAVRDYGDGIDEDEAHHLFDRFYRGSASRDRHGSGLGLAIVRQVAETHGGSAAAANAAGGGAVFQLLLPPEPPAPPSGSGALPRYSAP